MAFQMATCYTDETSKVAKHLREGWEPFSVLAVKVKKKDVFVTRLKIYFKKTDELDVPVLPTLEFAEAPKIDIEPLVQAFSDWFSAENEIADRRHKHLVDVLGELIEEVRKIPRQDILSLQPKEFLNIDDEEEIKQIEYKVGDSYPKTVDLNVAEEDEKETIGGSPTGDNFRVVEDIPPEALANNVRTEGQDRAIAQIRSMNEGTNLTIYRPDENGIVKVLVAEWIYQIKPDGSYTSEQTNANTSSLVV